MAQSARGSTHQHLSRIGRSELCDLRGLVPRRFEPDPGCGASGTRDRLSRRRNNLPRRPQRPWAQHRRDHLVFGGCRCSGRCRLSRICSGRHGIRAVRQSVDAADRHVHQPAALDGTRNRGRISAVGQAITLPSSSLPAP